MRWFNNISDLSALRKEYKRLAVLHHPDKGGSTVDMQQINAEYDIISKRLIDSDTDFSDGRKTYEYKVSDDLKMKIDQIIHLKEITIEVIGSWIWVTGNTKPVKEDLKSADFKFSRKKSAWYWHCGEYRKKNKKNFDLDELRCMWGTDNIENEAETETEQQHEKPFFYKVLE